VATAPETERSFVAPAGSLWCREPFRLFFPLAVVLGWFGIGHWVLYVVGAVGSYSCLFHGLVQVQAFLMAFAIGFLFTAIPRRTGAPPPTVAELTAAVAALCLIIVAAAWERWVLVQLGYASLFVLLLQFAIRRFLGRDATRRPPAPFVLIPIGALHGLLGAASIAAATLPDGPPPLLAFGRLLVEQGVFLCWVVGIGGLVLPLMSGEMPPADLGSSPGERRKALAYALAGVLMFASFVIEQQGGVRAGPLLRAGIVGLGLALGGGAWRPPGKPGLHRRQVWIAVWLMPVGLAFAGLAPDYRVPALHVLFIGGFSLMAFSVATHVSFSHLDLPALAGGSPAAVVVLGGCIILSMLGRVTADWSDTYFEHLGAAAVTWMVGSAVWLAFLAPKLLRRG
jgi:uncharacterized protein involved in response to NO